MQPKNNAHRLWYDSPAKTWVEALPLGNGRLGAMVFSRPVEERIGLNEDSLWSGYPQNKAKPGAGEHFPKVQALVREGKIKEAEALFESSMEGRFTESFLPLGDLNMRFSGYSEGDVTDYHRELSLDDAVVRTTFTAKGVRHTRTAFVSHPDQALIIYLEADKPGSVSVELSLDSQLRHAVAAKGNRLEMEGFAPSSVAPNYVQTDDGVIYEQEDAKKGMRFLGALEVENTGGALSTKEDSLIVEGADSVLLRFGARTSFNGFAKHPFLDGAPYRENLEADLALSGGKAYSGLFDAHVADHHALFGRVALELSGESRDDLPTDQRLRKLEKDNFDAGLFRLIFQYGRYLTVAGSRPGTHATNLQGIWNKDIRPAWSSNYTVNINTEMNYWPSEICGLSECHQPLFELIRAISVTGAETARSHYGAGGFTSHHNVDIWALTNPVGDGGKGTAIYAFWPMSAGWLCRHLYEHYEFTLDKSFLRESAWPLICGAAEFYLDLLEEDEDGHLLLLPSTSPENAYLLNGVPHFMARTTTMTMAIVRETLENLAAMAEILGLEDEQANRAKEALPKLYPFKIGSKGQLVEWDKEYEEAEPHHRHNSHLYPLHPAHNITPEETPELADACRQTLRLRGDDGTGWCLGWRLCLWARLKDGDHALKLLRRQLKLVEATEEINYMGGGGTYPNLFDAHPPFQIDGNYGTTAGMAELFVQSRGNRVELLPALPSEFTDGSISGLRAHGGLVVDIAFTGGKFASAALTATVDMDRDYRIVCGGKENLLRLKKGERRELTPADFR
ncbi:MAG: glycosyl hydrolase family 95 catalytic domain-containing protein [Oscillospiraceae bacterium]